MKADRETSRWRYMGYQILLFSVCAVPIVIYAARGLTDWPFAWRGLAALGPIAVWWFVVMGIVRFLQAPEDRTVPFHLQMNETAWRYSREMLLWTAVYVVVIFGATYILNELKGLPSAARVTLSLAPLIPALFMLKAIVVFVQKSSDELWRKIIFEALLIATGMVGFGTFSWGFLELGAGFPKLPIILVLPMIIFFWTFALAIVHRRYHR